MTELGIDIETYSEVDLEESGLHRYVEDPSFEILLISYSIDNGPVQTIDLAQMGDFDNREIDKLNEFEAMLTDPEYLKTAWNAQFEMTCLAKYFNLDLDYNQWECTMCKASLLSYPMSLEKTGAILKLNVQKDKRGKELIKLFSTLSKATKRNPTRTRTYFYQQPNAWREYISYNQTDVVVEQEIRKALEFYKWPKKERLIWALDQKINKNGIMIDPYFVSCAIGISERVTERLMKEARELTGIDNPNSIKQLKEWLEPRVKKEIKSLDKEAIKKILGNGVDDLTKRMLEIRQELGKSSIKKYWPMQFCLGDDHRVRGLLQYNGASKTGRWGSRLIQVHNLTKNKMPDIDLARQLVRQNNHDDIELIYGNVSNVLSELVRTAFIAPPGHTLLASDYSAIEARVLAWFANEKWRLEVFATTGKIYEASGARMFNVPIEQVVGDLRFKAKTAELALGYQGGVGAIVRMEEMGLKTGLNPEEMQALVYAWRNANKRIVQFWYDLDNCAIEAVQEPGKVVTLRYLKFVVKNKILFIQLPSGRLLSYIGPFLKKNKFDKDAIHYWGIDQDTKQWSVQSMYGGKFAENVVQAASRDILANGMLALDEAGFKIVMHVHDEVVMEIPEGTESENLKKAGEILGRDIPWAPNLPLKAVSFTSPYYIKEA